MQLGSVYVNTLAPNPASVVLFENLVAYYTIEKTVELHTECAKS